MISNLIYHIFCANNSAMPNRGNPQFSVKKSALISGYPAPWVIVAGQLFQPIAMLTAMLDKMFEIA
jgi:hypothetical protein